MKDPHKLETAFYQHLGQLFYAMSLIDGTIHEKEIIKMRELISREWLRFEKLKHELQKDSTLQILTTFDWCVAQKKNSKEAFEEFLAFYNKHKEIFDGRMKTIILRTVSTIAAAFSNNNNRGELHIIAKLFLLFKK
jgi:hypothetical protein